MYEYTKKRCTRCLLQEDHYRGIVIGENGLCTLCQCWQHEPKDWNRLRDIFERKIESIRGQNCYDGLLMMSGGKDSAYLAYMLVKLYSLKLLAFTIDNGYEYRETFDNARDIAEKLNLPHIIYRLDPSITNEFYSFIITSKDIKQKDFGQICFFCGHYMYNLTADFAMQLNIPIVFTGYNPEQLFGMGKTLDFESNIIRRKQQQAIRKSISYRLKKATEMSKATGKKHLARFFEEKYESQVECIYPFLYFPYQPMKMIEMVSKELNWKPIKSFCSSNYIVSGCKLLKLLDYLAYLNKTSSYMDLEFSSHIRQGILDKETVEKYYHNFREDENLHRSVLEKLGISEKIEDLL